MNRTQGSFYTKLGMAVEAMGKSDCYCKFPIACVTLWIEPAIWHDQIHFFRDDSGHICGYMTWAWLAEDTEQRVLCDPNVLLHISEWNEGDRLWIMDFLVRTGNMRRRIREAQSLFKAVENAKSVRRSDDGCVTKVTIWKETRWRDISHPTK